MAKYTDNLIPIMTSDENEEIKLSCSAFYTSRQTGEKFLPFLAFDRNLNSGWNFQDQAPPSEGHWIKIFFKKTPICIQKITIANASSPSISVKNFKIQGSNDDVIYEDIYVDIHPYGELDTTKAVYEFNNIKKYSYYKLIIIDSYYYSSSLNNKFTYGGIGELEMMGKIPSKYLIKQNNQYYTIKSELYSNGQFKPLILTGGEQPNENDYENFGFDDVNDLLIPIQVGEENFRPYDKLNDEFEICMATDKETI